jgi:AcrR family transcriptional regulator
MRESTCPMVGCRVCAQLRGAAVELATSGGMRAVTHQAIARHARVSPEAVAEHYATVDECLTDAYDEGIERLIGACSAALIGEGAWQQRLLVACEAAIAEFAEHPRLAQFCLVEVGRGDLPRLREHRVAARERCAAMLAEHRPQQETDPDLPDLRFEVFAGATHHAISEELQNPACDAGSIRARFDHVVDLFEPAQTSATL